MSTVAPPPPSAPPPPPAPSAGAPRPPAPAGGGLALPRRPMAVRLVACLALAMFGAQMWGDTVRPEADGRVVGAAAVGALLGLLALLSSELRRPVRALVLAALTVAGAVAALLLAGVPAALFDPDDWDSLASGLADGISALPGLSVPYRGVDEWNRIAVLLGGTALAVAGPLLACWPRRPERGRGTAPARFSGPGVAAVLLTVLYAVPAVQLRPEHPFVDGTIFALLLAAVLLGERLAPRDAPVAVPALLVAALVGLALAPRLDATDPWVDYEGIAQSLGERGTTNFSWDHSYGPLDWARDGREVLRIRSDTSSYWKATTLADFDGVRWREIRPRGLDSDPAADTPDPEWVRTIRVSVRNLRTPQFIAAGTTLRIDRSPRTVVEGAPGSYVTADRELRRGHAYLARVYDPRPRAAQLAAAGSSYPSELWPYLSVQVPRSIGGPDNVDPSTGQPTPGGQTPFVVFPAWGDGREPLGFQGRGYGQRVGGDWIDGSRLARTYRLAQRLGREATTPYDYVRRVQAYLNEGFTYTETPPAARLPLDAFLFRDKAGYCQQFSGAMALLLRMGGVPARVASGFSPGTFDGTRREYVVRDLDAHSWVEAYFPGFGWMTFDPTPAIAPARAQASGIEEEAAAEEEEAEEEAEAAASERGNDPAAPGAEAAAAEDGGAPVGLLVAAGLLVLAAVGSAGFAVIVHRRHARMTVEDRVRELDRALRRSGRVHRDALTLQQLEHRLRGAPEAEAYVRMLRLGRYGFASDLPTPRQRAAVRRQLGAGLGWKGRLRALWALPPW